MSEPPLASAAGERIDSTGPRLSDPVEIEALRRYKRSNVGLLAWNSAIVAASVAVCITGTLWIGIAAAALGTVALVIACIGPRFRRPTARPLLVCLPLSLRVATAISGHAMHASTYLLIPTLMRVFTDRLPAINGVWWIAFPLFFFLGGAGCTLVYFGRFARVPGPRACAKCGYELGGNGLPRCPECGTALSYSFAVTETRAIRRPALAWSGVALLLVTVASVVVFVRNPLAPYRAMPTDMLSAIAPRDTTAMFVVRARPLSGDHRRRLAQLLLDRRASQDSRDRWSAYGSPQLEWLSDEIAASRLDADQIARYFAEGASFAIKAPATARASEPFEARLAIEIRGYFGLDPVFYAFGGFEVEGPAQVISEDGTAVDIEGPLLRGAINRAFGNALLVGIEADLPTVTLRPTSPGRLIIRARVVIAPDADLPSKVTWPADGSPPPRPDDAAWWEVRTMEVTIDVKP